MGLLVVGLTISTLTAQARSQAHTARHRETQVTASYELSRKLAAVHQTDEILQAVISHASQTFDAEIAVFLPGAAGLALRLASGQYHVELDEGAAAAQVFQHQPFIQPAPADYICLQTARHTLGVLGVKRRGPGTWLPEQRRLLESFASQTALALERAQLVEQTYQMELWQARERLYTALLNSISHDLRTPLASITGVLSTLRENQTSLSAEGQVDLLETAWEEAKRLNRLVGNLLDMSRLEAGALTIRREAYEVQDLLGVTLAELGERLREIAH